MFETLDEERHDDECRMKDDRRTEDAEDRRRERPHGEQARINGRLLARQLLPDEDDEEDRGGDRGNRGG